MLYDFDYYSGRDIDYPSQPARPRLDTNATAAEVRAYADKLESYEKAMDVYNYEIREYNRLCNARLGEFKERVRNDNNLTEAQFIALWPKAWVDGHADGLQHVLYHFDELLEVAKDFAAVSK